MAFFWTLRWRKRPKHETSVNLLKQDLEERIQEKKRGTHVEFDGSNMKQLYIVETFWPKVAIVKNIEWNACI